MTTTAKRLCIFLLVLSGVLLLGTAGFVYSEGLSVVDALYLGVVTVATVGYGDITPSTDLGKLTAVVLIVTGVGTFLSVIASATDLFLERRQEKLRQERLSMAIGLFFSEVGTELLRLIAANDPDVEAIRDELDVEQDWSAQDFRQVVKRLRGYAYRLDPEAVDFEPLRDFLRRKAALLLRMLENQNLLEHESFTDLLRAVFHLKEELLCRGDLATLPASDRRHLAGDARRAYPLLVNQWLSHLLYLQTHYPYLFSLAVRTNPFQEDASPVVT